MIDQTGWFSIVFKIMVFYFFKIKNDTNYFFQRPETLAACSESNTTSYITQL